MIRRLGLREKKIFGIDEVQTLIYAVILLGTLIYGISAMDSHYAAKERRERARYRTGTPPHMVDGVVAYIADADSTPYLSASWRSWMHKFRTKLDRTEFLFLTHPNLTWYALGPTFQISKCAPFDPMNMCAHKELLETAFDVFPNLKWIIKVYPSTFVNMIGVQKLLEELPPNFYRSRLLLGALTQTKDNVHIDGRSGWFMSRRTARDIIEASQEINKTAIIGGSVDSATNIFKGLIGIDLNQVVDPRFNPNTVTMDEYSELYDTEANICPQKFRYFAKKEANVTQVRYAVTWDLQLPVDERRVAMMQIPRAPSTYGYLTGINHTELCTIPKLKKDTSKSRDRTL